MSVAAPAWTKHSPALGVVGRVAPSTSLSVEISALTGSCTSSNYLPSHCFTPQTEPKLIFICSYKF